LKKLGRRQFIQAGAASCLLAPLWLDAETHSLNILESGKSLKFEGRNYIWDWSEENDHFRVLDQQNHVIASGPLQPVVIVRRSGGTKPVATPGTLVGREVLGNRVRWNYVNVNGSGKLSVTWRFDPDGCWLEPVMYESSTTEDVISLSLFAEGAGDTARPALAVQTMVIPGMSHSPGLSPIIDRAMNLDARTSIGRSGTGITQQWALPSHYFAGFHRLMPNAEEVSDVTNAFCCGLTELPTSDLFVDLKTQSSSLVFEYRSDLWGQMRGPGKLTLGAGVVWTFAPNYREAIRRYYKALLNAGIIRKKNNSAKKNARILAPQWCTWGEQVAFHKENDMDENLLETAYQELKASGLQIGMLSIDLGWEGKFGSLEHSAVRFPHFEQFLDRVRADGHRIGMWAAFMRCEDPAAFGLTPRQMIRLADGTPYIIKDELTTSYVLDFTRPEVEKIVRERARRYIRRYKPDLVKFDFGYEVPLLDTVAPHDMGCAGEKMLSKALEVVVGAMREEDPDIALMYYALSPLYNDYLDLHSIDDLWMARDEYDLEANRRFFFSSLCGEFGTPTYGSSGYDWLSAPNIWFDSVAIGTLGSVTTLKSSEVARGEPSRQCVAKYNGLSHLIRPTNLFTVQPIDPVYTPLTRGAHASSWVRYENDQAVLVALRTERIDGGAGKKEFGGILSCTASLVIASRTNESLERSTNLALVPYGEGAVVLRRQSSSLVSAKIVEHYFGGQSHFRDVEFRNGVLEITLHESDNVGLPIEWIEVEISPV
jgi:hypothetical protein